MAREYQATAEITKNRVGRMVHRLTQIGTDLGTNAVQTMKEHGVLKFQTA